MAWPPVETWPHALFEAELADGVHGLSTPDDGRRGGRRDGLGDHAGSAGELGKLKAPHRAVPKDRGRRPIRRPSRRNYCVLARPASSREHSDWPTLWPSAARNGNHIPPPMQTTSANSRKRRTTSTLSPNLAPPRTATKVCPAPRGNPVPD
jgi:hypothetical protein